jgi:hypothetical protein
MNCYFCQQPIVHDGPGSDYYCNQHARPVRQGNVVKEDSFLCFDCYYHGKRYAIYFWLGEPQQISHNSLFSLYVINGNGDYYEVLKLQFHPKHITPDNIEKKLPTLLTFL